MIRIVKLSDTTTVKDVFPVIAGQLLDQGIPLLDVIIFLQTAILSVIAENSSDRENFAAGVEAFIADTKNAIPRLQNEIFGRAN